MLQARGVGSSEAGPRAKCALASACGPSVLDVWPIIHPPERIIARACPRATLNVSGCDVYMRLCGASGVKSARSAVWGVRQSAREVEACAGAMRVRLRTRELQRPCGSWCVLAPAHYYAVR